MNSLFQTISEEYNFNEIQKNQYQQFINFLQIENKKHNLTRISEYNEILYFHFLDSLISTKFQLLDQANIIFDIGTGGGIPGIILAIFYPKKTFYLNEIKIKKIHFLENCIFLLKLKNCIIVKDDFLTSIRKKTLQVDYFIARASIPMHLALTIYQYSRYKKTKIIYWVGPNWKQSENHNCILTKKNIIWEEKKYTIETPEQKKNHIYLIIKKIDKK